MDDEKAIFRYSAIAIFDTDRAKKMTVFVCEIDTYQSVLSGLEDTYSTDRE